MAKYQLPTKPHKIEVRDLHKFVREERVLFASSSKEQKFLYATLQGSFQVWHFNELILETVQDFVAVEKYNEI